MRKLISIMFVIILVLGGAMALAEYRENGGSFKSFFSSEANSDLNNTQVSTNVTVTPAPAVTPALKPIATVTPNPNLKPIATVTPAILSQEATSQILNSNNGMSFYTWLREAQNTESGALWGTFDEENAQRITFIEDEEISGYTNLMVAGKYFSVDFENRKFSDTQKANKGITFNACDKHEGMFFDWHSKATGAFVRYELTPELVDELKEVAVTWVNEDGETMYGVLCCQHNSSGGSPKKNPASNGGGNGGGNGDPTPTPAPTPTPTPAPTPTPNSGLQIPDFPEETDAPPATNEPPRETLPPQKPEHNPGSEEEVAENQEELEGQGPRETVSGNTSHNPSDSGTNHNPNQNEQVSSGSNSGSGSGSNHNPAQNEQTSSGSNTGGLTLPDFDDSSASQGSSRHNPASESEDKNEVKSESNSEPKSDSGSTLVLPGADW